MLNKAQSETVMSDAGKLLVLAGAGTGKTTTMLARISHLVNDEDIDPKQILVLTFTNAAAVEMCDRYRRNDIKESPVFCTFHGFCYSLIAGDPAVAGRIGYIKAIGYLKSNTDIDPVIFNEYSTIRNAQILSKGGSNSTYNSNPIQWFKLPWGQITLFSSLSNTSIDFPVYPKGFDDGVSANYDTMPEMLYQYEPWQIYKSSGLRTNTYDFDLHRDMWTGDHKDGKCNELIRFCEANCYPEYRGASVQTSTVSLYIAGKKHITGIMTDVKVSWDDDSPIGLDGFYLHLTLSITITEVADTPLNYETVQKKGLIE